MLQFTRKQFEKLAGRSLASISAAFETDDGQFERLVKRTEEEVETLLNFQPTRALNLAGVQKALRALKAASDQLSGMSDDVLDEVLPLLVPALHTPGASRKLVDRMTCSLDRLSVLDRGKGGEGKYGKREATFVRTLLKNWVDEMGETRAGHLQDEGAYQFYKALIPVLRVRNPWAEGRGMADMKPVHQAFLDGFRLARHEGYRET